MMLTQEAAVMSQEMSGRWVGPCKVADFFKLTMPIYLRKGNKEKLPKIDKKFFVGNKPANKKAMVKKTIEFFGTDNFTGLQLVDTSSRLDPNSKHGPKLRPGLALRDKSDLIDPNSPTHLGEGGLEVEDTMVEILSDRGPLFELESDTAQQARDQLATYAVGFCSRQHRTHLFFVYLFYPYARFIRFDRAGALVSERFKFTNDCTPLIRFFSRFSKMTPAQRGYDPTVHVADELETKLARERLKEWAPDSKYERPVFKMEVHDDPKGLGDNDTKKPNPRTFLVWGALADPESPLGRATRGYPALEVTHGLDQAKEAPIMLLKEQWRSIALRPEIITLQELKDKGVKHVPTLECGGDLPGQVTQTAMYAAVIRTKGGKDIDTRIHVRFVTVEVGRPIERFSSSKEMFKAVYDAFQGHKQAYEELNVEEVELGPRAHERTGTWAFMSIDLLRGERRPHKVSDDLESFFWVVLYYSLLYLPHNKVGKLDDILPAIFEQYTFFGLRETKGGNGKHLAVMEGDYIGDSTSSGCRLRFDNCKPLSRFVTTFLRKLKLRRAYASLASAIAADEDGGPSDTDPPDEDLPQLPASLKEHNHKDVEHIWNAALGSRSWPMEDAAKYQIVKGSEGHALAEVAGGGGSKESIPEYDLEGDDGEPKPTRGGGSKKRESVPESGMESDDWEPKPKKVKSITPAAEGPKERKPKKMPSATRRSTRLHKRSTN
ncbi:hypothetical protein EYR40_000108 [Pleurotus pulmonarius]|nr:hypothetical protein EYR40_000108 [Pleurotus pulmonarius]